MSGIKIGKRFCQCGECKELFNSPYPFDKHRIDLTSGVRGCKTKDEMLAAGFSKNSTGYWISKAYIR